MSDTPVDAILLAAGLGRRLGHPKAALQLRGQWMLPILVETLRRGGASRVILVLSNPALDAIADLGDPRADREVCNRDPDAGRMGSVQAGLREVREGHAALVHPCDMPLLQVETVQRIVRGWQDAGAPARGLARPVSSGRRGGHPLLIGPAWRDEMLDAGVDQPLRDWLHDPRAERLDLTLHDPGAFLDIDTPEQRDLVESLLPE